MKKKQLFISVGLLIVVFFILLTAIFFFVGGEMEKIDLKDLNSTELSKTQIESFKNKTILFGHQSVGANIIQGLNEISDSFNIVKSEKHTATDKPAFIHFRVRKNGDPYSKIDHFVKIMTQSKNIEIAFLKFCYADIKNDTDVDGVFKYYKKKMGELERKYPKIKIIHSTIPLYKNSGGIIAKIKHFLKLDKNIQRNIFNEMMRKEYSKDILFDLALFESTYPDGRREKAGNNNYSLAKIYTDDGGHLNKKGRQIIASNFINFISKL